MTMQHKKGVFEEKCEEYWKANKTRKSEILRSLVEVAGLTKKACIKRLRRMQLGSSSDEEQRVVQDITHRRNCGIERCLGHR